MNDIIHVKPAWKYNSYLNYELYKELYTQSIRNPEAFWAERARHFDWHQHWTKVKDTQFHPETHIRWFRDARLNITENCLDRHLKAHGNKTAIIWEGDEPGNTRHITYMELFRDVCRFANVLKSLGIMRGDRVTIYLPMIPEAVVAMLACARIGAIHSVVFAGFSASALRDRIDNCQSTFIITADEGMRGGKRIPLKANVDEAIRMGAPVSKVIVVKRTGAYVNMRLSRDHYYDKLMQNASAFCPAESMDAESPLFILYTSGSTGKPKGVLHTTGGYMVWAGLTHKLTFNYHPGEVYWCSADVGWVTGHSYIVYGPLLNAATTVIFEGVPNYPDFSRFWNIIDAHKVNIFYTAPTAIRALMREGDDYVKRTSRKSLRLLGSVGEPINPEAWRWYYSIVGEERCPIVDTWWQTETGGVMMTPLPGSTDLKPGAASWPFFGVRPVIVNEKGKELKNEAEGMLCIADSWPGQARTIYGDHERFEQTYFSQYPGYYFTGDGVKRDEHGYYWITGRVDDVLNVSGHRLGTAEIESALVEHPFVAEAAVVGFPHDIKGQGIYCYVTLKSDVTPTEDLPAELIQWVRKKISPIAAPDRIHLTPALPKTRSGKIMRRILRKIAEGEYDSLGDISTLTNPEIVEKLIEARKL